MEYGNSALAPISLILLYCYTLPKLIIVHDLLVGNASALLVDPHNVRLDIYRGGRGQSHHYRSSDKIFL